MKKIMTALILLAFVLSGCSGGRKYYQFDHTQGDKWVQEIAFIVLVAIPAYDLSVLSDKVVFNSVNLWTGKKPVAKKGTKTVMVGQGQGGAALLLFDNAQEKISLQLMQGPTIKNLFFVAGPVGVVAQDEQGQTRFSATTASDGSVTVFDSAGEAVQKFTPEQVAALTVKQG